MLSRVIRSKRAVQVVRTFIRPRELLATHQDSVRKVEEHDRQIATSLSAVEKLLALPEPRKHQFGVSIQKTNSPRFPANGFRQIHYHGIKWLL